MSSIDSDNVHCDHSTNECDGFKYFSKNKEEQLRQLKPFANKDSACLTDLIRKAWNSFSANDKAIYHEEANVTLPEVEKRTVTDEDLDDGDYDEDFLPSYNDDNDKIAKHDGEEDSAKPLPKSFAPVRNYRYGPTYPAIIYIIELNSIFLQDNQFASNQKGLIKMLWLKGWILLRQEQREEYGERSKKNWMAYEERSPYQLIAEAEFTEFVEALDHEADGIAVKMLCKDLCSHETFGCMGEQLFFKMTPSQRDEYYDMAYRHRVFEKACELFGKAELTDKVRGSYCMECDFKNLTATKKKYYLGKAKEIIRKNQENLRKGIKDTASIEDYDAIPVFKEMHRPDNNDQDHCAFNVYLIKMRPLLCQEPGMETKRCFELNLILKQRWNSLNAEDKQSYYKALPRIAEMEKEISKRKFKVFNFFQNTDNWDKIFYDDLSAEEKLTFEQQKLALRKQLLEDFPDLNEYFYWKHTDRQYPESKIKDVWTYDSTLKEYPGKPFIVRQVFNDPVANWFQTTDPKAIKEHQAFHMFAEEMCNHCADGLNDLSKWQRWFELSDDEQAQYYKKLLLSRYKSSALWKYYQKVDPTDDESNMFCTKCGFENMDKAEKKTYMKKGKRDIQRGLAKDMEKEQRYMAKEVRRIKKRYHSWPKTDKKHLYIKHIEVRDRPKMLVNPHQSLEWNVFYQYFRKHIKSFSKDPEYEHLPYSRICEKVEQSFWDLPDDERKPYFDTVLRYIELKNQLNRLISVDRYLDSENENSDSDDDGKRESKIEKEMMQARLKLLRDNPDLTDYFYFEKLNCSSDESDDDEDSTDEEFLEKMTPTPFMCYVQAIRPLMEQEDPEFAEMYPFEQRWEMIKAWKKLSKKQKAVYYKKQERVQGRVKVKQFFEKLSCFTVDESEK